MTIINMSGGRAGKTPVYQARTVQPTTFPTTVQPQEGYDALSQVTVNAPANLLAQNIRKDVNIAGVVGTYEAVAPTISLQQKTVTPAATSQNITPDEGYDGLSQVTVYGDGNLKPSNVKSGVNIFGVTGTYMGDTSNDTVGWNTYDFEDTGPTFPMILVGPYLRDFKRGSIGAGTGVGVFGNQVGYAYSKSRGYYAAFGATVMPSSWFKMGIGEYTEFETDSNHYTWSDTNRDSSTMDSFLSSIANAMGNDYFSGTLSCYKAWVWWSNDTWGPAIATYEGLFGPKDIPFTYSNGRCTYTLSALSGSSTWSIVCGCGIDDDPVRAQPALFLRQVYLTDL